ncbi:unnamed protein product [Alopecurus aequalis]
MAAALRRLAAAHGLASGSRTSAAVSRIRAQHMGSEASYLKGTKSPAVQIAETKEELYSLMTVNADKIGRENLGLLKQLCVHVEPKPNDPTWRFYRRAKRISSTLFVSCFLFGGVISSHHRSEGEAPAAANKQEILV